MINALSKELNILRVRTTPYHPQSNGKTERFHRVLNDILAKTANSGKTNWDLCKPAALMAYRTSVNDSTHHTPFFLVHGRDPVLPLDTLLGPKLKYYGEEYVPIMLEGLNQAYLTAKLGLQEARERNKEHIAKRSVNIEYKAGDAVYYHDITRAPGASSKLASHWKPFFQVAEMKSPVNAKIKHQVTGKTKINGGGHNKEVNDTTP